MNNDNYIDFWCIHPPKYKLDECELIKVPRFCPYCNHELILKVVGAKNYPSTLVKACEHVFVYSQIWELRLKDELIVTKSNATDTCNKCGFKNDYGVFPDGICSGCKLLWARLG